MTCHPPHPNLQKLKLPNLSGIIFPIPITRQRGCIYFRTNNLPESEDIEYLQPPTLFHPKHLLHTHPDVL
jgi:hypothetical protein